MPRGWMNVGVCALVSVSGLAVAGPGQIEESGAYGQSVAQTHRELERFVDSGAVVASSLTGAVAGERRALAARPIQEPTWSTVVRAEGSDWVRVRFDRVDLSGATGDARESYLRITSLRDGLEQYLDADDLEVWGNTSAYFNGDAVRIEIMASPNARGADRVVVSGLQASPVVGPASICGSVDDRELSDDPRSGRLMPIGCSAWLFGDHGSTMLTAGHCNPDAGDVVQFNVPLSTSGGGYVSPPPQDQYVVDGASIQESGGATSLGNDWGFFGVFDNTTTGLSPLDAQGDSYELASSRIASDGRPIRITGYGTTSLPVSRTWNGVQKTHVGPFRGYSGTIVRYSTDTTGGNSGSVILDDTNNIAIGIHTNAGCGSSSTSANNGCDLFNSALQAALANPSGIAAPRTIQASVSAVPEVVSPSGGDVVTLQITNFHDRTIVDGPAMMFDDGNGFAPVPVSAVGGDAYEAVLPSAACGTDVSYYFELTDSEGETVFYPDGGASAPLRSLAADSLDVSYEDDFQTDRSWLVSDTGVTEGGFEWGTPASTTASGGPRFDADGSGRCYMTGRGFDEDLDGGRTSIASPLVPLVGIEDPTVRAWVWVNTEDDETMRVEFSSNFGASWVLVDEIGDTGGWIPVNYLVGDHLGAGVSVVSVRFSIEDEGADSNVEGAVDGFVVASVSCDACAADFTGDGSLDFFDLSAFLDALGAEDASADIDGNGSLDFFDLSGYLTLFGAGCP